MEKRLRISFSFSSLGTSVVEVKHDWWLDVGLLELDTMSSMEWNRIESMKETKTVLEKLTRYKVYTYIYKRGITFGSDQT